MFYYDMGSDYSDTMHRGYEAALGNHSEVWADSEAVPTGLPGRLSVRDWKAGNCISLHFVLVLAGMKL